jgi:hypothetical protein
MSDPSAFGFGQFVPGFDFLQNLSKAASPSQPGGPTGMPGMGHWVAPTLSVEDIDKRIQELKSVLFWLEQNTTALKATIQAMEVQKMTLSTLQSMNVSMADLAKAFTAQAPAPTPTPAPAPTAAAETKADGPKSSLFTPKPDTEKAAPEPKAQTAKPPEQDNQPGQTPAQAAVDPMQWWGALTQQFQGIAAAALKDVAGEAMKAGLGAGQARPPAAAGTGARAPTTGPSRKRTKAAPRPKSSSKTAKPAKAAPAKRSAGRA